jgi:hypothetical protein
VTDYGVLFSELAVPRLVGTPNHAKVREILTRELEARGFSVERHAFRGRPARLLFGVPRKVQGVNLIGRPDGQTAGRPQVWLVAHYDSKGQPVSMAVRLLGAAALLTGVLLTPWVLVAGLALLLVGVVITAQNRVTDKSPGALDNATAVVAVLMTLDQLSGTSSVGVIFPDAEEYGLVGARALARERPELLADTAIINLDGVDDVGGITVFAHRPGPVGDAVARALEASRWRWLPVVVDGIALARAARECVTILKGNLETMRVVHTPRDSAARLRLDGAASVAAGLARVLRDR